MSAVKERPCPNCAAERRVRIALDGERARLRWDLQKARNRVREIGQQTAALAITMDAELARASAEQGHDPAI